MSITTMSSREFNQDPDRARNAADKGPVIIVDGGRPTHVLLGFEEYQKLTGTGRSLLDIVALDQDDDIDFDPPRMGDRTHRPVSFDRIV